MQPDIKIGKNLMELATWSPDNDYEKQLREYQNMIYTRCYVPKKYLGIYEDEIKNVIFNNPATIVFWGDGSKTVVKCDKEDEFDPEKGLAMAIAKHFMGTSKSKGNYYKVFEKWIPKEEEENDLIVVANAVSDAVHNIAKLFRQGTDSNETDNG